MAMARQILCQVALDSTRLWGESEQVMTAIEIISSEQIFGRETLDGMVLALLAPALQLSPRN